MTARAAVLALALLLAAAAPAAAKELGSAAICGAAGCTDVTDDATEAIVHGGSPTTAPRTAEPYYVVRVGVSDGRRIVDEFAFRWLPKAERLRGADGVWMTAPPRTQRELARLSAGMEPIGVRTRREEDGGGGPSVALAIGAPAGAALAAAALLVRRRRRRS
jgi:hypothetical protein